MMDRRRQTFADRQADWAHRLLAGVISAGVREIVISPGSRSSPLVLAAMDGAAMDVTETGQAPPRCHIVVDERAAAFFALGCARATGRPAALICTSGSAGAHYLPALVEARHAFLPMIVLTADRPWELIGCGANQAIDQTRLFGDHVVGSFEVGLADDDPDARRALGRLAHQAVSRSQWPTPGGVHLNLHYRKPLEPTTHEPPVRRGSDRLEDGRGGEQDRPVRIDTPRLTPSAATVARMADALRSAKRPLIACGPMPIEGAIDRSALEAVARGAGVLLATEATSQARFRGIPEEAAPRERTPGDGTPGDGSPEDGTPGDGSQAIGACRVDAPGALLPTGEPHLPDLVLQLGAPPTSRSWSDLLQAVRADGGRLLVAAAHGWPDPDSSARERIVTEPAALVEALGAALASEAAPESAWIARRRRAEAAAWRAADRVLARDGLSEAAVMRLATSALGDGDLLAIGNSLPVRLLDAWVPGDRVNAGVSVLHQRGASGIDGLVSGAAGAAVASGRRTLLVLGDVSLLHDLGGLAAARGVEVPFVVLAIDNGGGRIFDLLPIADHPAARDRFEPWHTPPRIDFAAAARTFGIDFHAADDAVTLTAALEVSLSRPRPTLIVATTPPGEAARDLRALATEIAAEVDTETDTETDATVTGDAL